MISFHEGEYYYKSKHVLHTHTHTLKIKLYLHSYILWIFLFELMTYNKNDIKIKYVQHGGLQSITEITFTN